MKERLYVQRAGPWWPKMMDSENEALLGSWPDVVSDGKRETPMDSGELVERMQGVTAVLSLNGYGSAEITEEVLRRVGTVRVISRAHYWGESHYEGLPVEMGIQVVDGSNAGTVAVAEWCLAAALAGVGRMQIFDRALKMGSPWGEPRMAAGMLSGRTAGVIGLGRTGLYVARLFKRMGLHVIARSRSCTIEKAAREGIRLVHLDELLRTADIVSLHEAVNETTRGALGAREFATIPTGAVFINSARAALYDEQALIRELAKERFAAFIDVFAEEPIAQRHPFRGMRNVVITPHIAGNNLDMLRHAARDAIVGLKEYFAGNGIVDRRYSFP